jgi:tripartite-type tricarboxylate transporter receptor subunit TctC
LPGFFASLWYGLWVPRATPRPIVARLNAAVTQTLFAPQVRGRFEELGIQIAPLDQQTPEALGELQKEEAARWWPIIKTANIKVD